MIEISNTAEMIALLQENGIPENSKSRTHYYFDPSSGEFVEKTSHSGSEPYIGASELSRLLIKQNGSNIPGYQTESEAEPLEVQVYIANIVTPPGSGPIDVGDMNPIFDYAITIGDTRNHDKNLMRTIATLSLKHVVGYAPGATKFLEQAKENI